MDEAVTGRRRMIPRSRFRIRRTPLNKACPVRCTAKDQRFESGITGFAAIFARLEARRGALLLQHACER